MLLFIQVQHDLLYYINQLNLGFLKIGNKNDARILQKRVNARAGKSRDFVANTKLWYIGAKKRATFVLLVRKVKNLSMRLRMTRRIMHIVYGVVHPRSCFLVTTIFQKFFPYWPQSYRLLQGNPENFCLWTPETWDFESD